MKYQYIAILLIVLDNCILINNLTRPLLADSPTISLSPVSCVIYSLKPGLKYFCATYFSNGKTLNGTILLPQHANVGEGIRYGMIIRMNGGYYSSYIQQEHNGSLTRQVVQVTLEMNSIREEVEYYMDCNLPSLVLIIKQMGLWIFQ